MTYADSFFDAVGVMNFGHFAFEEIKQFAIVFTHADDCFDTVFDKFFDLAIVIALVFASENEHRWWCHAFESIPCGVDISRFRIVDISHAIDGCDMLQTMFDSFKILQWIIKTLFLQILFLVS